MKMSVREARANFAAAIEAAERGEQVVITRNGKPVAELGPAKELPKEDFLARLARVRIETGVKTVDYDPWPEEFDDPGFSREVLGLTEDRDPARE